MIIIPVKLKECCEEHVVAMLQVQSICYLSAMVDQILKRINNKKNIFI